MALTGLGTSVWPTLPGSLYQLSDHVLGLDLELCEGPLAIPKPRGVQESSMMWIVIDVSGRGGASPGTMGSAKLNEDQVRVE